MLWGSDEDVGSGSSERCRPSSGHGDPKPKESTAANKITFGRLRSTILLVEEGGIVVIDRADDTRESIEHP